jgi:hypothetical protein
MDFYGLEVGVSCGTDQPPGLPETSTPEWDEATMSKTTNKYSPEVVERVVRLVLDNQGQHSFRVQAIMSISATIG